MSQKVNPDSKFYGPYGYGGTSRDDDLAALGFYLRGKPDTKGWRDAFANEGTEPVEFNGRILPDWAVEDVRILFQEDAQTVIRLLAQHNLSLEGILPLE